MSYLIDTNVLAELRRKAPNDRVVAWMARRPASSLYLSVLTLGELRKGVEGAADAARRALLLDWLETELPTFFTGRILPVDAQAAVRWGRLVAAAHRPVPAIDSLIGATAAYHGLSLVTRNVRDYADLGLDIIDPWAS
ncbi:MAG: type II toxin-antitoxin system VapC family toxin [Pseudomonadota bacterium]